ncbi:MAG: glycosyltransferase family 4 protein [Patescibacteria group bacterium]
MKVLFLTKGNESVGSSRWRVFRIVERLDVEARILFDLGHPFWSMSYRRFQNIQRVWRALAKRPDVIVVHKVFVAWEILFLVLVIKKIRGVPLIFDLDDAEWIHSPRKSVILARSAAVVTGGSHEILEWAHRHARHVQFIPTAVDTSAYRPVVSEPGVLGWIGNGIAHMKAGNFTILKDALEKLSDRGVAFSLVVIGSQQYGPLKDFFKQSDYRVTFVDDAPWALVETIPALLAEYKIDIGLMPLVDTPFNRAKCAFKAIEYMACGIPTVASDVGESRHVIDHGVNGFVAGDAEEFTEVLARLVEDRALRSSMSVRARQKVEDAFSLDGIAQEFDAVLRSLGI